MGRQRQSGVKRPKKKKEYFFGFNNLRQNLRQNEKDFLINFFQGFQKDLRALRQNLCQVNAKFDAIDCKVKKFENVSLTDELEAFANQNIQTGKGVKKEEEEFSLNDDDLKMLLDDNFTGTEIKKSTKNTFDNFDISNLKFPEEDKKEIKFTKGKGKAEEDEDLANLGFDLDEIKNIFDDKPDKQKVEDLLNEGDDFKQEFFDYKNFNLPKDKSDIEKEKNQRKLLEAMGLTENYEDIHSATKNNI